MITYMKIPYFENWWQLLCEAVGGRYDREILDKEFQVGKVELFKVNEAGHILTRFEQLDDDWRELVVCCAQGKKLIELYDSLERLAINNHADAIRFHTEKKSFARLMRRYGFEFDSYDNDGSAVYVKVL